MNELQPNQSVHATFLVHSKDIRQKRTGEPYLSLLIGDRTGELDAKMWDNVAEVLDSFDRDDFIRVKGLLQVHQNRPQLTIHKMERVAETEVDFSDYFPASKRDPAEMAAELAAIIGGISNSHLQALLRAIFDDPAIARGFRLAPAAKIIHHAFLGGLLEHVLSMCSLAQMAANHYKYIDRDLLLTGVLLHDVGKIRELTYDRSFGYSDEGQLIGHISIGLQIVQEKAREIPGFPDKLRVLVGHMVLSHHGQLDFGSPKLPLFPEALLLHLLDNLDSKMEAMRGLLERDSLMEGCWTGYSSALERAALKKERYLAEPSSADGAPKLAQTATPPPAKSAPPR
ncbi:MAG: 3'-5' exoribonuclease YhaM family protein, partial [Bryobacteraceae bacterium]